MESRKFLLFSTFFPPYHLGGDATHVENLAKLLSENGNEVHVVYLIDSYAFKKGKVSKFFMDNCEDRIIHHPLTSPFGNLSLFKAYSFGESSYYSEKCQDIVSKVNPDVIHYHNIAGFGPSILKYKARERKLYTAHDYWLICQTSKLIRPGGSYCRRAHGCEYCQLYEKRPFQFWRMGSNFRNNLLSLDCIIAPSEFMKNILFNFGINNYIEAIPNFVANSSLPIVEPKGRKYFLYVGLLNKHKGIMDLILNYDSIYNCFGIPLHIVGAGPLDQRIINHISKNNMVNKIKLIGKISDYQLRVEYSKAMALFVPSVWPENNPMVVLEALSHGTPVIGKAIGGIPEIIDNLDHGLLYNTNDELMTSIEKILDEPSLIYKSRDVHDRIYSDSVYLKKYMQILI